MTHPLPLAALPNISSLDVETVLLSVPPASNRGVITSVSFIKLFLSVELNIQVCKGSLKGA